MLLDVRITAKKDVAITAASVLEAPGARRDVQHYYSEIDRPHATLSLLTSSAKSPTGKLLLCASTSFLFEEPHGQEPRIIHEMWDNNLHLMKFGKALKAGQTYAYAVAGSSITSAHPAMTQAIFALLSARPGDGDQARHFFQDAYLPSLLLPFRVIAETKGGTNPYFATGAGGVLQAVLRGFGGLEITPAGIAQRQTTLPTGWQSVKIAEVGVARKTHSVGR